MDSKLIGAMLLIVGTSIGAGMLALPIATANLGFFGSLVMLFGCWAVMTSGAFLILETNLWLPANSNMMSMAKKTLGPVGQIISWFAFCFLQYALLAAYISAGSDLLKYLLSFAGLEIPAYLSALIFTLVFGFVVCLGIKAIDVVNRSFMSVKLLAFILLVLMLTPFIKLPNLQHHVFSEFTNSEALLVTITSFGYAAIIPSLRVFFRSDPLRLRKAIFFGSLIPLVCYIFWDMAIMGVISFDGVHGLHVVQAADRSTSELVRTLTTAANTNVVWVLAKVFTSICVVTSFLGVALCLVDFSADALSVAKEGSKRWLLAVITFLPPLVVVMFFPHIFIQALSYAGIDCVILLVLLPSLMVFSGRYRKGMRNGFTVPGGKVLLLVLVVISVLLIGNGII